MPSSKLSCLRRVVALLATALWAPAQTLLWPEEKIATIDAEHLRAYVPFDHRESLKDLIARADQTHAHMVQDAGFTPRSKLRLLLADWVDDHNGYPFVVPFPLVQVELAPALQESTIFYGDHGTERTLLHESGTSRRRRGRDPERRTLASGERSRVGQK